MIREPLARVGWAGGGASSIGLVERYEMISGLSSTAIEMILECGGRHTARVMMKTSKSGALSNSLQR